jgi:adenylate cyclase
MELFGMRTRLGRMLERAPFAMTVAIKALTYGSVIVVCEAVDLGGRAAHGAAYEYPGLFASRMAAISIAFAGSAFLFVLLMIEVARLLGPGTLVALVCGRYHRPRTDERFFLFVDVVGSTSLAERLGPEGIHRFLARVFRVSADAIDDHLGDVYHYVGDALVVTWTVPRGRVDARPLACFFAIEAALASTAAGFVRDFGVTPRVHGAVHVGPVTAGEIGDTRRGIVFHGDVMNTTSRLEQLTRTLHRRFVVSADALRRLEGAERYDREDLGLHALRGRRAPVHVVAIDAKA